MRAVPVDCSWKVGYSIASMVIGNARSPDSYHFIFLHLCEGKKQRRTLADAVDFPFVLWVNPGSILWSTLTIQTRLMEKRTCWRAQLLVNQQLAFTRTGKQHMFSPPANGLIA